MAEERIVVALEIGTAKTVALVGEMREDGTKAIIGMGEHPTTGVRKGEITDLENAVVCVRSALQAAEENSPVTIRRICVALSGGHIQSVVNSGSMPVLDPENGITGEDVKQVMNVARAINLPPDREILHTVCQHFYIDDQEKVLRPEGLEGAKLSVDMLAVYGVRNRINNTIRVVSNVPMEVEDVAFSGLCSALGVLTPEQKESGVLLVDLGGGKTDYVAYGDRTLAAAGTVGVGGDHVTNDIQMAFSIPLKHAERLKQDSGSALVDMSARTRRISVPSEVGFPAKTVSLCALQTVINARMDELFKMIRHRLDNANVRHLIGAGVVLTGGGALLKEVTHLAERVFGLPCSVGIPRGLSGLASATAKPEYATAVGLVRYALGNVGRERQTGLLGRMRRALGFGKRKGEVQQSHG